MEERQPIDIRDLPELENPTNEFTMIGIDENDTNAGKVRVKNLPIPKSDTFVVKFYKSMYGSSEDKPFCEMTPQEIVDKINNRSIPICILNNALTNDYYGFTFVNDGYYGDIVIEHEFTDEEISRGDRKFMFDSVFITDTTADVEINGTLYSNVPCNGREIPDYEYSSDYPFSIYFSSDTGLTQNCPIEVMGIEDIRNIKIHTKGCLRGISLVITDEDETDYFPGCLLIGAYNGGLSYLSGLMWINGETVIAERRGFGGCFAGDTEILVSLNGKTKPIKYFRAGDDIVYYDGEKFVEGFVKDKFNHVGYCLMANIKTDRREVCLTRDHPILTTEGYKNVDGIIEDIDLYHVPLPKLNVGDTVITKDGEEKVVFIEKIGLKNDIYSLTTGGAFVANGFIAKDSIRTRPEI